MNTRVLLWAFFALAIVTSAYAADSKPEMGDCEHPLPNDAGRFQNK